MESISNTIYSLFRDTPYHHEWVVSCLDGAWPGILGDRIAGTCKPVALRDSELVVEVLDIAWFQVLRDMAPELLQRIRNATGGEVRQLKFRMQRAG